MTKRGFWSLVEVSDERLERNLKGLIADGCRIEARIVAHLAEMDARKLSLIRGYSLFEYCQTRLGLSESQAFYRITAARAARRFPILFDLLEHHHIHLTTIALISKYLTEENHVELFEAVRGRSKREVLKLLARRFPRPDAESHIRKLPPQLATFAAGPSATFEPLSESTYRLQLNASEALKEKLTLAADLMSHSNPTFDLAVVVERALDLLIDKLQKQRFGVGVRPRRKERHASATIAEATKPKERELSLVTAEATERSDDLPGSAVTHLGQSKWARPRAAIAQASSSGARREWSGSKEPATAIATSKEPTVPAASARGSAAIRSRRRIANDVLRQMVDRDGLRCTYRGPEGHRCTARAFLQTHHEEAWAKGGADGIDNLRFLCEAHNQLLAEMEFGVRPPKRAG